jgi:hypothetical protein
MSKPAQMELSLPAPRSTVLSHSIAAWKLPPVPQAQARRGQRSLELLCCPLVTDFCSAFQEGRNFFGCPTLK